MKKWILAGLVALFGLCALAEVTISNLVVAQRPGTKLVDVTYDIISDLTDGVHILLYVEQGGRRILASSLSGDFGSNVLPGIGRKIVWNAGKDWSTGQIGELVFILAVNDREFPPAPVAKTGQTVSYREGDDGWYQAGVVWPNPRFVDNEDGTVTDHLTGLMWVKDPHALQDNAGIMDWESGSDFCNNLFFAAHSDWRLPQIKELFSLVDYSSKGPALPAESNLKFNNSAYWTLTTRANSTERAYSVNFSQGHTGDRHKGDDQAYVLPVRKVVSENFVTRPPKTGQQESFSPRDVGFDEGVSWPIPRFIDTGAGTVMDQLTGLEWVREPAVQLPWEEAIDYCNQKIFNEKSDWRLPTAKELESLVFFGRGEWGDTPEKWLNSTNTPFFSIQNHFYWSSTPNVNNSDFPWRVYMYNGFVGNGGEKNARLNVWPVRGSAYSESAVLLSQQAVPVDTSDYTLTVSSDHGQPVLAIGSRTYASGSTVICSVPETVIEQGIRWRCTGWTGTGSVPASGATHSTGEIALTDLESSITWHWETSFSITNVTVQQRPGTKLVDITYNITSDVTNGVPVTLVVEKNGNPLPAVSWSGAVDRHVLPGAGHQIVWDAGADWDGNVALLSFIPAVISPRIVLVPGGTNSGVDPGSGAYSLTVNSFYMDATPVTKAQWDEVYNWAVVNDYDFDRAGSGKASNHPVCSVNWYDSVKWCNARSEMEGRTPSYSVSNKIYRTGSYGTNGADIVLCDFDADGYRLPTVVEHQYASRGGLRGKRFPWGDTITHEDANYLSTTNYSYDISLTRGYHPDTNEPNPRTLPVRSFAPNDYGLFDMAGNIVNWCWDVSADGRRRNRGGYWGYDSSPARCATVYVAPASEAYSSHGFRTVSILASISDSVYLSEAKEAAVDTRDHRLVVNSSPDTGVQVSGTQPGVSGYTNLLAYGTVVELTVPESYGSETNRMRFIEWTGSVTGDERIIRLTIDSDKALMAVYGHARTVRVTMPQNGNIDPGGEIPAVLGSLQTFTAIPERGYRLKHWLLDGQISDEKERSLTFDVTGNMTIAAVFEPIWLVFEGRSQMQRLDETGGKRGEPVVLKEALSTLLVVNRDRSGETNAVLISWGKGDPQSILVAVSLDDSYPVSARIDKAGLTAAERTLWAVSLRDDGGKSLLLGTFDGAYRYDKDGGLSRVQQRASLNGAGLSPVDPSFSTGLLRLNQTAGDALNKADGDFPSMAAALRAQIKKLPPGVSAENLRGLLQNAAGE